MAATTAAGSPAAGSTAVAWVNTAAAGSPEVVLSRLETSSRAATAGTRAAEAAAEAAARRCSASSHR